VISRESMNAEYERSCRDVLRKSLKVGYEILKGGGSSVDAVVASVMVMEDDPHFNAGKGSVFTTSYTNELDAGLMDGWTGSAGGVSTVTKVKNPVLLARRIMDITPHTVLSGPGAELFAEKQGLEMVDSKYFFTQRRLDQLERLLQISTSAIPQPQVIPLPQLDHNVPVSKNGTPEDEKPNDTVGAVALDMYGRLATSSSTGGMTGKMSGRLSDSSIPGAGFWADRNLAVSMTGNGDYFLRRSVSHEIASLVNHANLSADEAAKKVIFGTLKDCDAGVIVVDANGNFSMPYNSGGMFRGFIDADGNMDVRIWEN